MGKDIINDNVNHPVHYNTGSIEVIDQPPKRGSRRR